MENKDYYITHEQLDIAEHYKRMFELNADIIEKLCSSEKEDVVYGFELGKTYSHLRDCFVNMMELEEKIQEQKIDIMYTAEEAKTLMCMAKENGDILYEEFVENALKKIKKLP